MTEETRTDRPLSPFIAPLRRPPRSPAAGSDRPLPVAATDDWRQPAEVPGRLISWPSGRRRGSGARRPRLIRSLPIPTGDGDGDGGSGGGGDGDGDGGLAA